MGERANDDKNYDVIIVGGGTAGCVLATRLTEDPNVSVLVLERGGTDENVLLSTLPANHLRALDTDLLHTYFTEPLEETINRKGIISVGNILGGSFSVSWLMYARPSPSDFDDWNMDGWTYKDVLPYFKKIESYTLPTDEKTAKVHGFDGPLVISRTDTSLGEQATKDALIAMREVLGATQEEDHNAFEVCSVGAAHWPQYVDPTSGLRQSASSKYLRPNMHRSNLTVITDALVTKILIDEHKTATGVEMILHDGKETVMFTANKQVVLSAGTFESPKLLELSGIGNRKILGKAGVETKVDLPSVGENFQDHPQIFTLYHAASHADTHDAFQRASPSSEIVKQADEQLAREGKGRWTTTSLNAGVKWRPTEEQIIGTDLEDLWKRKFANAASDKALLQMTFVNGACGDYSLLPPGNYYSFAAFVNYPEGRGSSHIRTNQIHDDPVITGFYCHKDDVTLLKHAYKLSRKMMRRMPMYRGEFLANHPRFVSEGARCRGLDLETARANVGEWAPLGCVAARLTTPDAATDSSESDIVYTEQDEAILENWVRSNSVTAWHPLGTCSMGKVVDERLNVYGVKRLKVCDMSVCPLELGGNTSSVAYMFGERGADLIREDLHTCRS